MPQTGPIWPSTTLLLVDASDELCLFQELELLADELRAEIIYTVSKIGGHLSASLGVAELSVALHHVFNTPDDKIIWDVGHQVQMS